MPRARTDQCSYKEDGRRCMRIATSRSPFCRTHDLVMRDAAKPAPARNHNGLVDAATGILDDILNGRRISRNKVATAINEVAWAVGGGYTDYHPDVGETEEPRGSHFDPPDDFRPPPRWHREPPPPPPPGEDPIKIANARRALGYGPSEKITPEALKARFRELAKRHHPDRGGSAARMAEINDAVDTLTATL